MYHGLRCNPVSLNNTAFTAGSILWNFSQQNVCGTAVCVLTEQLIPLLVMFMVMFHSLSQSQMMEMIPVINYYF